MNTILIHTTIAVIALFIWWLAFVLVQVWHRRKEPGRDLARLLVQWQEEDAAYQNTDWAIRNRQHGDYWYSTVFRDELRMPRPPHREIEDKVDWVHEGF